MAGPAYRVTLASLTFRPIQSLRPGDASMCHRICPARCRSSPDGVFSMSAAYNPNKLGWGAAALTCAMTAALGFTAYTIHKNTYLHPRDPMATQVYHARDAAGGEHAPAAEGEHAAEGAAATEGKPAEAKH